MFQKLILDNGIPVVMEQSKDTRSICIGIWVKAGARHEETAQNGISHFLEHMFFKGTKKRATKDISIEIDSLGGELNAFTSRESTTFFVKVLDEHIEKALDLLNDIFLNSVFPEEEIEKEKGVIFEEINLVDDTPEDYIHDLFNKNVWGEHGLGQSVLGKKEIIQNFSRYDLLRHVEKYYGTNTMIVSCSGNFDDKRLIEYLNGTLGSVKRVSAPGKDVYPEFHSGLTIIPKELSEVHLCLGVKGLPQGSTKRYAMHLLNTILGAGVSSRLFLEVREKRGLAYSIVSFNVSYFDTGVWTVYTGTEKKNIREVITIITDQIRNLPQSLTFEELQRAKNQFKGSLFLALESTSSKMMNIAKQEIYYGKYFSPEEIIEAVESVTLDDVKELSQFLTRDTSPALTVYGPVKEQDLPLQNLMISH